MNEWIVYSMIIALIGRGAGPLGILGAIVILSAAIVAGLA